MNDEINNEPTADADSDHGRVSRAMDPQPGDRYVRSDGNGVVLVKEVIVNLVHWECSLNGKPASIYTTEKSTFAALAKKTVENGNEFLPANISGVEA